MHVIVLGAGEVGSYVAERLSQQGIDVAVIENDPERLSAVEEKLDVMSILGSGTHPGVLARAGVGRAELLVAVTNDDEVNMMASLAAKQAGVDRTLVRLEAEELRADAAAELRAAVGADLVIDPDQEAARDILQLLEMPGASEVEVLAGGEVLIVGARLTSDSSLVGKTLHEVAVDNEPNWEFLFGTISRAGQTIIPRGNHELCADDMVRVLCKRQARRRLMDVLDLPVRAPRRVLLLGGGRTAELVALPLARRGSEVVIVEEDESRARELAERLHRVTVLRGDITDAEVLLEAEVGSFDAVAALTGADDANIIACLFANSQGAGETLAIAHRLELLPMLTEVGIDAALSPRTATADRVISLVRGEIAGVATFLEGPVEILEYEVAPGSAADGAVIAEMDLPDEVLLGAVVHEGSAEIARGRSKLAAGDHVVAFAMPSGAEQIGRLFA
ncbi:MAG: Trk system potassium transporter TrkA [Microthrixaceae bacterium]